MNDNRSSLVVCDCVAIYGAEFFSKHREFGIFFVEGIGEDSDCSACLAQGSRFAFPVASSEETVGIEIDFRIRVVVNRVVGARGEGAGDWFRVQEMFEFLKTSVDGLATFLFRENMCLATILRGRRTREHLGSRAEDLRTMWDAVRSVVMRGRMMWIARRCRVIVGG